MDEGRLKAKDHNEGRRKEDGSPRRPIWRITRESIEKFMGMAIP